MSPKSRKRDQEIKKLSADFPVCFEMQPETLGVQSPEQVSRFESPYSFERAINRLSGLLKF